MNIFRAFFFSHPLRRFQWYRRWYGGRWERHFIDVCRAHLWLPMHPDRKWPKYRQPCSVGIHIVEDWPAPQTPESQP